MAGIISTSGILDCPIHDSDTEAAAPAVDQVVVDSLENHDDQSLHIHTDDDDSSCVMVLNTEPAIEYNAVLDSQAAQQPVPLIKRGDTISVMDCQDGMTVVAGKVVSVVTLEYPNDYTLALVRCDRKFIVGIHKSNWLRMADGVRSVENDAMATVESYLQDKNTDYLSVASGKFGGKNGFSPDYVANKLWKKVSGKRLKPNELLV